MSTIFPTKYTNNCKRNIHHLFARHGASPPRTKVSHTQNAQPRRQATPNHTLPYDQRASFEHPQHMAYNQMCIFVAFFVENLELLRYYI